MCILCVCFGLDPVVWFCVENESLCVFGSFGEVTVFVEDAGVGMSVTEGCEIRSLLAVCVC